MEIIILTIFPETIRPYFEHSIMKRGIEACVIKVHFVNPRDFTTDKHHQTDDTPYGGGAGMVMKVEPIHKALQSIKAAKGTSDEKIFLMSAKGKQFTHQTATKLAKLKRLVLIAGRYEGVDERVARHLVDGELSIGPYVLAGGELPAAIVAEAVARHIPGVLGNKTSLKEESHTTKNQAEYPQYTKPENYNHWPVPKVLLSGNHRAIADFRKSRQQSVDTK